MGGSIFSLENITALITLTAMELVLGIDNIVFIAVVTSKLPEKSQGLARRIGLGMALVFRIALLSLLFIMTHFTKPLVTILGHGFSLRDVILISGGLFLITKATHEIHAKIEGVKVKEKTKAKVISSFRAAVIQIAIIDIVFSFDSIITAIGMARHIVVMVLAVIIAVIFMMFFSGLVSNFIERHPTLKMLALSFLLLIGVALVADGFGKHIDREYIYFAMGFSVFVEWLNIKAQTRKQEG
ncbi:MAG: TerC family protein [Syntrophobacterales bacterium]|nr:TerC family protein [Syntrophobacterales bacterium]